MSALLLPLQRSIFRISLLIVRIDLADFGEPNRVVQRMTSQRSGLRVTEIRKFM
jgi:hypothetical protein